MLRKNEYRTHTCGELRESDIGKHVTVSGWLENVRDHGGVKFADLRDQYGIVQVVVEDETMLDGIPKESAIRVTGFVAERDEDTINKKLDTGYIEIEADSIDVLGKVREFLPFDVTTSKETKEDLRLKYRFLDLRNVEVQKNIILRSQVISFIRSKRLYNTKQKASRKILCIAPSSSSV